MTAFVTLHGVAKQFDNGTRAIDKLDLEIAQGEFVALLGPSGCGKSTALRIVAGLLEPTAGHVTFPLGKPEIGFVFQEPTLMPWATAHENARLPLDLRGMGHGQADSFAATALARVGLSEFGKSFPRELSGGMKMRVSIARAIASAPKLLLMDEPFAALDELTRQALNDDLLSLCREDGLSVIFVTHSVYESAYLSSRVVIMTPRPGRVDADVKLPSPLRRDAAFRLSAEFAQAASAVSAALKAAMQRRPT